MKRKFLVFGLLLLMGLFVQAHSLKAEDATLTQSVTALEGLQARNVFGVVGRVDYVEFKSKTGSAIVVEDSKGQLVKI
ncbi:MAG: hypothetical protein HY810_07475 [Candidatus Omnitrophica bacterium]|nr:hypothetical protein [Candidatus Omnitrophota bacterium]